MTPSQLLLFPGVSAPTPKKKKKKKTKRASSARTPLFVPCRVQCGDLWQLGKHRLLCGDATSLEDVARLMDGASAQLCLTDPPYNVGLGYLSHDDHMMRDAYTSFCAAWWKLASDAAQCVIVTPGMKHLNLWYTGQMTPPPRWTAAWYKANQCSRNPLGGFNCWEPLLIWGKPAKRLGHDAWNMPIHQQRNTGDHPCPKLLEFWRLVLESATLPEQMVYDCFLGSGTTLLAAEEAGRVCRGLEIEPHYCDIILARWEHVSGQHAMLLNRRITQEIA